MMTFREYLAQYKKLDAPISGGWANDKQNACVIERGSNVIGKDVPLNLVELEYSLVGELIHFDLIVRQPEGQDYAGIEWNLVQQELIHDADRRFDRLRFEVTAFPAKKLADLIAEHEGPEGKQRESFDEQAFIERLEILRWTGQRDFWFDITNVLE